MTRIHCRLAILAPLLLVSAPPIAAQEPAAAAVSPIEASLTVTADPVRREKVAETFSGTGLVVAEQEATIGAMASGLVLTAILVSEGESVQAGALLARLDDALLKAEIAEQQAAIQSAEASYTTALSAARRGRRLSKSGSVSAETVEERETTVKTAAAGLAQAKAALGTLEVQLARTLVRAPFAGIVSAKPATVGVTVQAGTELVKLQRDGALRAAVDVPEQHLAALRKGGTAEVVGPSGATIAGFIATIGETVDPATHLGRVEIALPKGAGLKAGMFVRATMSSGDSEALTVATSALTWRDGRTAVFVVGADNRVRLAPVGPGIRADGRVAVAGDIKEGDRVVTSGPGFLGDGEAVRVVTEAAAAENAR